MRRAQLGLAEPPDPDAPGPFRLSAPDRLRALLEGAGLAVAVEEEVAVTWVAGSLDESWAVSLDTSRMLAALVERLEPSELDAVRARVESLLSEHVAADGTVAVPGVARVVLGRPV